MTTRPSSVASSPWNSSGPSVRSGPTIAVTSARVTSGEAKHPNPDIGSTDASLRSRCLAVSAHRLGLSHLDVDLDGLTVLDELAEHIIVVLQPGHRGGKQLLQPAGIDGLSLDKIRHRAGEVGARRVY